MKKIILSISLIILFLVYFNVALAINDIHKINNNIKLKKQIELSLNKELDSILEEIKKIEEGKKREEYNKQQEKVKLQLEFEKDHVQIPKEVKSVYYTAHSTSNENKLNELINLANNKEINSVTINIKTISGYTSFDMSEYNFDKIKPTSNKKIKDITSIIKKLHENNIYVIGRVVVFKDKLLSNKRPDLAIKTSNQQNVWTDYKGNKYLDPYSQEVWDYNANIATAAYEIGFDEINFDYVRFPTDGKISDTYYPFSNQIKTNNPYIGNYIILDEFSNYITNKIKNKYPRLILSADVFGLVTNIDLKQIGQKLESFILYFDYIGPMIYPSHYGAGYNGYIQPDNNPYEILYNSLDKASNRIDILNKKIKLAKESKTNLILKNNFKPKKNLSKIDTVKLSQIRPWIQGFSCSRCKGAIPYNRTKFRKQIKAIEDMGLNSWWVWSSGNYYYSEWYNK